MENIGIIGAGLIGGSIARAARGKAHITIIEETGEKATKASALGLGDVCTTDLGALSNCDLVILATSVTSFGMIAKTIMPHLKSNCILSDVASVKGEVVRAVTPFLRDDIHFIPAHPIAGTQFSGLESGFAELFAHKWVIITPLPSHPELVSGSMDPESPQGVLRRFWESLGAHVATMNVAAHDAAFATTSHLPHAIAFSLMQAASDQADAQGDDILKFSASSFGDYTRVAGSDPALWRDIFLSNRDALLSSLDAFNHKLSLVTDLLKRNDADGLVEFIAKSRIARKALEEYKEKGAKGF